MDIVHYITSTETSDLLIVFELSSVCKNQFQFYFSGRLKELFWQRIRPMWPVVDIFKKDNGNKVGNTCRAVTLSGLQMVLSQRLYIHRIHWGRHDNTDGISEHKLSPYNAHYLNYTFYLVIVRI